MVGAEDSVYLRATLTTGNVEPDSLAAIRGADASLLSIHLPRDLAWDEDASTPFSWKTFDTIVDACNATED